MKIITQSIEVPPTKMINPLGEYTHLLRLHFKHEDQAAYAAQGIMLTPIYCVYCRKDNSLSQITEEGATELAVEAAFRNSETSRPTPTGPTGPTG